MCVSTGTCMSVRKNLCMHASIYVRRMLTCRSAFWFNHPSSCGRTFRCLATVVSQVLSLEPWAFKGFWRTCLVTAETRALRLEDYTDFKGRRAASTALPPDCRCHPPSGSWVIHELQPLSSLGQTPRVQARRGHWCILQSKTTGHALRQTRPLTVRAERSAHGMLELSHSFEVSSLRRLAVW